MCNRFRGVKDWSQLPRELGRTRINFDYNPNVARSYRGTAIRTAEENSRGVGTSSSANSISASGIGILTTEPLC